MKYSYLILLILFPYLVVANFSEGHSTLDSELEESVFISDHQENPAPSCSEITLGNFPNNIEKEAYFSRENRNDAKNLVVLNLSYTFGKSLGCQKSYGTFGGMIFPFFSSCRPFQIFLDGKAFLFDQGKWGGSVGIGLRHFSYNGWMVGLNGYYDYRRFNGWDLNQLGLGVELLGDCVEFRVNGYLPINKNRWDQCCLFDYSGSYFATLRERGYVWSGLDTEIGTWLVKPSCCQGIGLYVAAGPYYYRRSHDQNFFFHDQKHHTIGGKARILATLGDFIELSMAATHDSVWHTRVQGRAEITVPFDYLYTLFNPVHDQSTCLVTPSHSSLTRPVYRQDSIVVSKNHYWTWNWCDRSMSGGND
ncbi:inverse autotransporter beta domain-containing protein [Candidatus Protochlamydia sp. W-9]|uniref:inverse autotransporter beta domain-containing protein n=1 Tax=Candidatus Protochlamydia sp. W-9 TaxID=1785087 RepID=UPI00096ABA6D|nr:inverse autotransporter beta domain-containing protein [Candidatus Protochlamydia sp. W-9]